MEATGYIELTIVFVTLVFSVISILGSLVLRLHYHRGIVSEFFSIVRYFYFRNDSDAVTFFVLYG